MSNGSDEYEPLLNARLAKLLNQENLNASAEQFVKSGSMDVRVSFDRHIVAIECENFGLGKPYLCYTRCNKEYRHN